LIAYFAVSHLIYCCTSFRVANCPHPLERDHPSYTGTMPVVKGGVWTNIEDEILKAAISKYGLNQWQRVSSLLARKTAKQCKARWDEWLDPSIRKIEWSREEDEKLLHLAKLMPTQWRTIAPMVGRTANQCLERYNKLLDDAQSKEDAELGLAGVGDEAAAPSADDVRRLRPGEIDPDPESKPARPDTIDLDEDEKEMLSEARARLANTQGKKAKRKARERQLEESRRIASLQKRRELKMSGINTKLTIFKKGEMNYNADIPFERAPVPGFYDTAEEKSRNELEKEAYDPRKQQLANKRKGEGNDEESKDAKRRKNENKPANTGFQAAMKAAQAQKIREAEQLSKRKALVLPAPQVSDAEMDGIIKMSVAGERATSSAGDGYGTRGLVGDYTNMPSSTPIRTPRVQQEEDRISNEIANIRALNETKSALLGGENVDLIEGAGTTGFGGMTPSKNVAATPNPMATPLRQANGTGAVSATPLRTPRDNLSLNRDTSMSLVSQTPRDLKLQQKSQRSDLLAKLASLPKPKESEWELELPEERDETSAAASDARAEDASIRDKRERLIREAAELSEFKSQSMVVQKRLPRPTVINIDAMLKEAKATEDVVRRAAAIETVQVIANDGLKFGSTKIQGKPKALIHIESELMENARFLVAKEIQSQAGKENFDQAWKELHISSKVPGLDGYYEDEIDEHQLMIETFDSIQDSIILMAEKELALEKKLIKLHGGYLARSKMLSSKISDTAKSLDTARRNLYVGIEAQAKEDVAITERLEKLRDEVGYVTRREREEQEVYRSVQDELQQLKLQPATNGTH
jgi:pre-mRNA-splicing factor CDC5/CEF1